MNNWKITSIADLQSSMQYSTEHIGSFVFGDNCAHEWSVIVKEGNEPVSMDGYSATAYILRPDGNTVPVVGTINGNKITAVFPAECYAVDGWCSAVMKIEKSGVSTVSIATIKFLVSSLTSEIYVDPGEALDIKIALEAAKAAVSYNPQSPSETRKSTARANIDAANVALEKLLSIEPQTFEYSGNPVQFESFKGMPLKLVMKFEPIQPGNGDPFPGGGGRNLFNIGDLLVSASNVGFETSGSTVHVYTTGDGGTWRGPRTNAFTVRQGVTYTLSGRLTGYVSGNARFGLRGQADNTFLTGASVVFNAETGYRYCTFIPAADQEVYMSLLCTNDSLMQGDVTFTDIQLEIGEVATDYEPWENIRAIFGRDSVTLQECGKNLFQRVKDYSSSGITVTVADDGKVTATGTAPDYVWTCNTYGDAASITPLFTVAEDTPVTLSGGTAGVNVAVQYITASGVRSTQYTQGQPKKTFTLPAGASLVRQYIRIPANTVVNGEVVAPQMEIGETATEFESYCGSTFTQPLDQTVYGGTLDWNTGVLTVDRGIRIYDGVNYTWSKSSTTIFDRYLNGISDALAPSRVVCSHAPSNKKDTELNWIYINDYGTFSWNFATYGTTTVEDFNAYLAAQYAAGTPVQVCYKLASPTVIQLTPQQITALTGVNTVYCNGDALTVSGRTDIMGVIEHVIERMAALESAGVADANISS